MPRRRRRVHKAWSKTPTQRLILELGAISVSYRSFAFRKRAAEEAGHIPQTQAEQRGNRMGDLCTTARGLLRAFAKTEDLDELRALAVQARECAAALDTKPGTSWSVTTYQPRKPAAHHAA